MKRQDTGKWICAEFTTLSGELCSINVIYFNVSTFGDDVDVVQRHCLTGLRTPASLGF